MTNLEPRVALLLLGLAALGAGCVGERPPPVLQPEVQLGQGAGVRPGRVLVLSASCGSIEFHCPPEYVDTVDNIVRSSMDFAGYVVVDPATLRAQERQRHETHARDTSSHAGTTTTVDSPDWAPDTTTTTTSQSTDTTEHSVVDLDGPGFEDLTVAERRAVVAQAGADAVMVVRIVVGAENGVWAPNQRAEVLVKLAVNSGDTMAWASRCAASSNDFATVSAALEGAARCAVHGATGR